MTTTAPSASLVTAWLPITTAWSAPAICSSLVWEGFPPWLAVNDPGYGISVNPHISCLPAAATPWWEQPKDLGLSAQAGSTSLTTTLLGPITCPEAYTTATTSVVDSSTLIACCPSDYTLSTVLSNGQAGQCTSRITAKQEISLVHRTTITSSSSHITAWVTTVSVAISDTVVSGIQMNGWNVASQTSSPNSSPKPQSSSSPVEDPAPSGLRTDVKIAIGVSVSVGVLVIAGLIMWRFWLMRRKSETESTEPPPGPPAVPPSQLHEFHPDKVKSESVAHEIYSGFYGHELDVARPVGELYGSEPGHQ